MRTNARENSLQLALWCAVLALLLAPLVAFAVPSLAFAEDEPEVEMGVEEGDPAVPEGEEADGEPSQPADGEETEGEMGTSGDEGAEEEADGSVVGVQSAGNDTIDSPKQIWLNRWTYSTTLSRDDVDFFKVTIPTAGEYTISFAGDTELYTNPAWRFWTITAYDQNRNVVMPEFKYWEGDFYREDKTATFPAGTCIIQVQPNVGLENKSKYRLRISAKDAWHKDETDMDALRWIGTEEVENNDSPLTANRINFYRNIYAYRDSNDGLDWFAFYAPVAGDYKISFSGDSNLNDNPAWRTWRVTVYDYDRNVVVPEFKYWEGDFYRIEKTFTLPVGACFVQVKRDSGLPEGCKYHIRLDCPTMADAKITGLRNLSYTGQESKQEPKVTFFGKVLQKDVDYTLTYLRDGKECRDFKSAGTIVVRVTGLGPYKGYKDVSYDIWKNGQPMTAWAVTRYASASALKQSSQVVDPPIYVAHAVSVAKPLEYRKKGGDTRLNVDTATGRVTVRKGTPAGTYNVTIRVIAFGGHNYADGSVTVESKVIVR